MKLTLKKSDRIGVLASALCMIHCVATPFIFIAQCTTTCCDVAPDWWIWIDYFFLTISFFAVYHSSQNTTKKFIKSALWISWSLLFVTIINERLLLIHFPHALKYIAGSLLVILHLYNQKYCQCKQDKCCANNLT